MKLIFERIYHLHHWYDEESKSGPGATFRQTERVRQILSSVVSDLRVKTLLDIPCGDFHWMKEVDLSALDYCGADIVSDIVNQNQLRHGSNYRNFIQADVTTSDLPEADLILCRDCLVHFSYKNIKKAIANIQKSQSKYLLTTTFPGRINKDIRTGEWRPIDLESPPFSLQKPLRQFNENCTEGNGQYGDKSLALWEIAHLYYPKGKDHE